MRFIINVKLIISKILIDTMNIEEIFIKNLYFFMKTVIMYGRENNCRTMFSKGI